MVCNNCDRSIKDDIKICPYCGFILERHEVGATEHHNYAIETALAHNLKLTDEVIDNYGFSYKSVANVIPLLKNPIFIIYNVCFFIFYYFIFLLLTGNVYYPFLYSIVICIFNIILELLFSKTNDKWFKGIIPIYNLLNLFKLYIRDYKAVYKVIYLLFSFTTIWTVSLFLFYIFIAGSYIDYWFLIIKFFIELELCILVLCFLVYVFKSFYCVGYRFRLNPYLVMFLSFIYIPYIVFNSKLYYHEDQRV